MNAKQRKKKKNQTCSVQQEGSVTSIINQEICGRLKGNEALAWADFDGPIRQCLHALHSLGGIREVRDALDVLHTSTFGKPRRWMSNPKAYIHKILKNVVRELGRRPAAGKVSERNLMMSSQRPPLLSCVPVPMIISTAYHPQPVSCVPLPLMIPHHAGQPGSGEPEVAIVPSVSAQRFAHEQGNSYRSTKTAQNPQIGDVSPGEDCYAQSLFRKLSEVSTIPSVTSSTPRECSSQHIGELDVESLSCTDCSSLGEEFLLVTGSSECDSKSEELEHDFEVVKVKVVDECSSEYGECEDDGFVVL
jgi:hypothetical protein